MTNGQKFREMNDDEMMNYLLVRFGIDEYMKIETTFNEFREMNDEELAEWFADSYIICDDTCPAAKYCNYFSCKKHFFDWATAEAD